MPALIDRVRDRKVVQWGLAYGAAAGVVYGLLESPAQVWGFPDVGLRVAQVLLVCGFFATLVVAWYHGERGEQRVNGVELLMLAGILALAAIGVQLVTVGPAETSTDPYFLVSHGLSSDQTLLPSAGDGEVVISTDGRSLAYVARSPEGVMLFHRGPGQLDGVPVAGTKGRVRRPFFSPDDHWLGFFGDNALKRVPANGGDVETIAVLGSSDINGAVWGANDTIYFSRSGVGNGIEKVHASGGDPRPVTETSDDEVLHTTPVLLPGGRHLVYRSSPSQAIYAVSLDSGERTLLVEDGGRPVYSESGHLLFQKQDGSLWAARMNQRRLTVGVPVRVGEGLLGVPSISRSGWMVHVTGADPVATEVVTVDVETGMESPVPLVDCDCGWPAYSPDGDWMAVRTGGSGGDVRVYSLRSQRVLTLTSGGGTRGMSPSWSDPDGSSVSFARDGEVWVAKMDGSTPEPLVDHRVRTRYPAHYSADGRWAAFPEQRSSTQQPIMVVDLLGDRVPQPFVEAGVNYSPRFSPDGNWLAYQSRATGIDEVWVRRFAENSPPIRISEGGGTAPVWGPDGGALYYRVGSAVWSVAVNADSTAFGYMSPREVLDGPYDSRAIAVDYDVHPSGTALAMTKLGRWEGRLVLTQGVFGELERLVPDF